MSEIKYDTLVFTGRFQPLHNIHVEIIRRACQIAREVVIIIGSADQPRTYKNPFTAIERKMMIVNTLDQIDTGNCRVHIESNVDTIYDDQAWAVRVQGIVSKYRCVGGKTGIIGHRKDAATDNYLSMFPQWEIEEVPLIEPLHATDIRDLYFRTNCNMNYIRNVVPYPVFRQLEGWKNTPEFNGIIAERLFVEDYKKQFEGLKYPPVFVTADAVVVQAGHVLLIRRKSEPGRGTFAVPGGFLNADTDVSVVEAALRELREETGLKVPTPVLRGSIKHTKVYDAISRSARGRTITHAVLIELPPNGPLPRVKGSDDAEKAVWVPISELDSAVMFEDHFDIVTDLIGKL